MDERGTDRGATSPGSGRPAGPPKPGGAPARNASGKGSGAGRPQAGQARAQGGGSGRPQGGLGAPRDGAAKPRQQGGSGAGRGQGGGSGRPRAAQGRPQGGAGRPAGGGKKVTGSGRKAAARKRRERRRRAIIASVVAGVIVVAVVAVALVANRQSTPTTAGFDRVATFGGLSRNHTDSAVHYAQTPPVGGDHNPVWQNCGYYPKPVHNENAVHDLEHGAVWITYQPNLPKAQVDVLANMARSQQYVLVSPYPGLPAPVVASGWGVQEWFHSANDAKLTEFVSKYRQGPQTPEPGALCTNGTGTPE
jgi:hypothetical protein